jgi:hypothetical protein
VKGQEGTKVVIVTVIGVLWLVVVFLPGLRFISRFPLLSCDTVPGKRRSSFHKLVLVVSVVLISIVLGLLIA